MASSPSFHRTLRSTSTLRNAPRQCLFRPSPTASRPFTTTVQRKGDIGSDREHVLDKADKKRDDKTNVQSEQSKKGRDTRAQGGADTATAQKDTSGQKDKLKQEHPEAPDAIGFQDHRGGKVG